VAFLLVIYAEDRTACGQILWCVRGLPSLTTLFILPCLLRLRGFVGLPTCSPWPTCNSHPAPPGHPTHTRLPPQPAPRCPAWRGLVPCSAFLLINLTNRTKPHKTKYACLSYISGWWFAFTVYSYSYSLRRKGVLHYCLWTSAIWRFSLWKQ
jgi:hypothetical protein